MIKIIIQMRMLIILILIMLLTLAACSPKEKFTDTTVMGPTETDGVSGDISQDNILPTEVSNTTDTEDLSSEFEGSTSVETSILSKGNNNVDYSLEDKPDKKMIAIDAGHQSKANNEKEPIGPGSSITKAKVSSGTQGTYTGVAEYKLNLVIAKKVKEELLDRGYEVYMVRDTNNVNLSNKKRAEMANESGADIFIRIHADSFKDSSARGASTLYPSEDNPYVPQLSKDSYALSKAIIDGICENSGAKNRGAIARDDMSGINWCDIPVSIIEMGYMSNKKEDKLLQTEEYQDKIVQGICDGIDTYFE